MRYSLSRKRTCAAEPQPLSVRSSYLLVAGIVAFVVLMGSALNHNLPGGVIIGLLAMLISAAMCAYWYTTYEQRGLATKPRISFREIYVLYFGYSIEVGLIVHTMAGTSDAAAAFALILPPILICAIAGIDDTPTGRITERRVPAKAKKEIPPPA